MLKVAAAAVIVVLAVGGAVALFAVGDTGATVRRPSRRRAAASKSAAEDSAASGVVGPEAATTAPNGTTVAAFPGIGSASATTVGTETVLRFVTDDGASAEVRGTPGSFAWANVSGAGSQVVIGIVPTDASDARVTFADGSFVSTRTVPDPAGAGSRLLVVSSSDASGPVRVDAIAADGSTSRDEREPAVIRMRVVVAVFLVGAVAACSAGSTDESVKRSAASSSMGVGPSGEAAAKAAPAADATVTDPSALAAAAGRQVVTNATLGMRVKRVGAVVDDATTTVTAAGGYLFSQRTTVGCGPATRRSSSRSRPRRSPPCSTGSPDSARR